MTTPADLPAAWRDRAADLRRYGAEPQALVLEVVAAELDTALGEEADEELTLTEAARESAYSKRRLRELIDGGVIPMAPGGRKGAPRIRRADLPRKANHRGHPDSYDATAVAADLLARRFG